MNSATAKMILEHIRANPDIGVCPDQHTLSVGLYKFSFLTHIHNGLTAVRGSSSDNNEETALIKAWGEFVERYSFLNSCYKNTSKPFHTSNGFASHTSPHLACRNALAELVERDIFLSCWLLNIPAIEIPLTSKIFDLKYRTILRKLQKLKAHIKLGIYGSCNGFIVGIACIYDKSNFSIATAAKTNIGDLKFQLLLDACRHVAWWKSDNPPQAIKSLPTNPDPVSHALYHLNTNSQSLIPILLTTTRQQIEFPTLDFSIDDMSEHCKHTGPTGFTVARCTSKNCQQLWFGETQEQHINLKRLESIVKSTLSMKDLNHEIHPLA